MLTLTRRPGEAVILTLPDQTRIVVELREISGQQARLTFHAPDEVRILREELATTRLE